MKLVFVFLAFPIWVFSQQWTLDNCIDTALKNNLTLKSGLIRSDITSVNLRNSKQNLLPSLSAGATHGYNWGQTIDLFTNQFATDRVMYENFYLSSSVVLFSGLQNYYSVKSSKLSLEEQFLDQQIVERNVKIDVSAAFLQVLLNKEMILLAINNIEKTNQQYERIKELVSQSQGTKAEQLEIEAQLNLDKYLLIKAENDLKYSKLLLQQLLNVQISNGFDVSDSISEPISKLLMVDSSIAELPEIMKLEVGIQKQELALQSTKGKYYPTLSLIGSIGSGYSENNKKLTASGEYVPRSFSEQITNNLYQSVFLSLSIPIFNKNATRNQVKVKELELKSLYFDKQNEYNQLKQKIEQISLDIINISSQLEALEVVFSSASKNHDNFEIQYEAGSATFTQLIEAKNKLVAAQSELLQANYQMLFKQMILSFY
ncbi:TolC family protein [Fluviicola taffensis]|uniref:Outer membrane efflux protein n=1 Tax=Fluviicola taffensis (strain DSM 16823 / NCIMB 13979 / RW262) TaxID=755732 RepID=F2IIL4_FLUTR|nr:TolC family protein [Fluviicola taffensis]AEA45976.1 outer membrane efflux protein [Fluviicola taffensis DSM 16823]